MNIELDPDVAEDYAFALIGGGVPSTYHLASAIYRGDWDEAAYYAKLELAVIGTQYGMLSYLNWMSPKNAISFRHLHHGLSFFRSQLMMNPLVVVPAAGAYTGYKYTEILRDPTHPHTRGLVQERKAGVISFGGPAFY